MSRSTTDHDTHPEETFEHVLAPTTSTQHSLSRAVYERRAEYTRPYTIRIKIGSWNVAACKDVERDIGGWFVEGKGIDKNLAGLQVSDGIEDGDSQEGIESVRAQEERRTKKHSTLPLNDEGLITGGRDIDLYVLGLQEVVELSSAKEYLTRVYTDPSTALKWKAAMIAALPAGYQLVSEQQLSGLLMLIYASPELAPTINSISSVAVGTGILGYFGNKGAITTRIVLGETTRLVFVNCHLASGTGSVHLERRCWDVAQILSRTRFDPISRAGVLDDNTEGIGEEDFAFWFGDLNFRLEGLPGEDIRRLLMLHTRGEYGNGGKPQRKIDEELGEHDEPIVVHHVDSDDDSPISSPPRTSHDSSDKLNETIWSALPDPDDFVQDPHSDPASLQATIDSLLPHDQLRHAQKKRMAFHDGWREGPISFLPTYKYDVGSVGLFDSSEKKRAPSWCDRILYRTRRDKLEYDGKSQEEELAKLKDEEMKARGIDRASDDDEVLFDYDPNSDGAELDVNGDYDENEDAATDTQAVITKEGYVDTLQLDVYTSHQRVLSSDHKPLDAIFTLHYDAVVPELKSKIQQKVAKELDRAENEGRPGITIVIDHSQEVDDVSLPNSGKYVPLLYLVSTVTIGAGSTGSCVCCSDVGHIVHGFACANSELRLGLFMLYRVDKKLIIILPATLFHPDSFRIGRVSLQLFTYNLTTHRNISTSGQAPPLEGVEGVDFGEVRYLTRKSRSLTIANTGRVPATFSFVKRPVYPEGNDRICPEWLKVSFATSDDDTEYENLETDVTLVPGDAVNVMLEIFVDDMTHVRALNRTTMQLDDVLVLRVIEGRDHFIPVRGSWLQSCLGRTVDELIRIPEGGVRALRPPRQDSANAPINRGQEVCWSAPRELFKLTEAVELLIERAVADKDMIESATFPMNSTGWPFEEGSWIVNDRSTREERRSRLLEALDNDKNLIESFSPDTGAVERLEIVAEVLVLFLGSIEDGIITTQLWDRLEQDMVSRKQPLGAEEERTWILDVLTSAPNHNISFVFLTSMLSKVAAELAPLPRPGSTHGSSSTRSSMDHRRSLSFKGRSSPVSQDPKISRRKAVARRWSEIFASVIFKTAPIVRDRDRRVAEDRKRQILEVFLQGDMENNPG